MASIDDDQSTTAYRATTFPIIYALTELNKHAFKVINASMQCTFQNVHAEAVIAFNM